MKSQHSKKNLILIGTLLIAIFPTLAGSALFINLNNGTIYDDVMRSMHMIGNDQFERVNDQLDQMQAMLIMLSKNRSFMERRACEMNDLISYTQYVHDEFINIYVLDDNNQRIAGFYMEEQNEELLERWRKVKDGHCITHYTLDEASATPKIEMLVPIEFLDKAHSTGVIGALINPYFLNDIIALSQLYGEEVESYIVDQDGYFITESRFIPQGIGKLQLDVELLKYHINYSDSDGYLDYRGIKVLGVCFPFSSTGWTLIVETDQSVCEQQNDLIVRTGEGFALVEVALMAIYQKLVGKNNSLIFCLKAENSEDDRTS